MSQVNSLGAGTGTVTGPSGGVSTDNAIVRWDGTTGTVIQNSVAILTDAGALSGLISGEISGAAADARWHFVNTATGTTSTDGSYVGIDSTGKLEIRQRENLALEFYTNNTSNMIMRAVGRVTVGDTTEASAPALWVTALTKFMSPSAATSINEILAIANGLTLQVTPSADTNTGAFGITLYAAYGGQVTMLGANDFSGGLPVGSTGISFSALGGFGSVNCNSSGTVDGTAGILFTNTHGGYGSAVADQIGGIFETTSEDTEEDGTPTGSITNGIGGLFAAGFTGCDVTNAASGKFNEPFVADPGFGGGAPTLTNKAAAWFNGTSRYTQTTTTTTGNIDDYNLLTGYQYNTGAAPVLRGIANGWEGKEAIWDFANTATISNENAGSSAANRITTGTGADILLVKSVTLRYNSSTSRWRVVSYRL